MTQSKLIATLAFTAALGVGSAGVGAASAADLGARPYTKAPVFAEPLFNWAGFYIGGNVGGAWTTQQWVNSANTTLFGDLNPGQGFRQHGSGIFGGGQLGYNWQASNFVFGLEGTIAGLDTRGTLLNTVFGVAADDQFSWRADWMATITGRAGYAVSNNLFYVKGGYAGVNNRLSVVDAVPLTGSGSQTQWHNGWTVGAGRPTAPGSVAGPDWRAVRPGLDARRSAGHHPRPAADDDDVVEAGSRARRPGDDRQRLDRVDAVDV